MAFVRGPPRGMLGDVGGASWDSSSSWSRRIPSVGYAFLHESKGSPGSEESAEGVIRRMLLENAVEGLLPFSAALGLVLLLELGDKTQLAVIILAATSVAPVSVFLGASLALVLMVTLSVVIGTSLAKFLGKKWLKLIASGLFLVVGVYLIVEALLL